MSDYFGDYFGDYFRGYFSGSLIGELGSQTIALAIRLFIAGLIFILYTCILISANYSKILDSNH